MAITSKARDEYGRTAQQVAAGVWVPGMPPQGAAPAPTSASINPAIPGYTNPEYVSSHPAVQGLTPGPLAKPMTYEQYMAQAPRAETDANGTLSNHYLEYQTRAQIESKQNPDGTWTQWVVGIFPAAHSSSTLYNGGYYGTEGMGRTGAAPGATGAPGGAGSTVPDPAAELKAQSRRDSYARLQSVLNDYGLGGLGNTVQQWLVEGLSEAEIVQRMRDTSEFKTRFPAIEERKKKGLTPISPGEYVAYERSARQLMRAAGLPEGYYDGQDDFAKFLTNDLSLSELADRVTLAANAAFKMPKEDRDKLAAWGMGPGDLTAFWLDPDKAQPLLERKYAAAQLAGAGTRSGWGDLTENKATELATLGVTAQDAEQGFGQLAQSRELFQSLDQTEDVIGADEQVNARFGGNAAAQRRIEQRRRKRQGAFESGGGFAAGQGGLSGLGDSSDF